MKDNTKLGILFLHHALDAVTQNNLLSATRHNPDATVVTMSAGASFPGGYTLEATPELKKAHADKPSRGSDRLVCSWFTQRKEKCDKWWIIEWDTFCQTSVRQYYDPVWNFPFVTSTVNLRHRNPDWYWFREVGQLPDEYKAFAMGASPFLYLVSDAALQAICPTLLKSPFSAGNGELRFCTAANKCGIPPCGFSPPHDRITHNRWAEVDDKKTIFHPVKHYVPLPFTATR